MSGRLPDDVDAHVGKRIRMQRLLAGMSQETLADKLGLTFQQVQKYEKGTNRVSAGRMHQIANALDVTIPYLYEGLPTKSPKGGAGVGSQVAEFLATKEGLAMVVAFGAISDPDVRRSLLDLAQTLATRT